MVLRPSTIYSDLEGKSIDEITAKIEKLKRSLERLKYEMEHPDHPYKPKWSPSDDMYMNRIREDLRCAKGILEAAGGTYCATAADLKYHAFCGSIKSFTKIIFTMGSIDEGFITRTIDVKDEELYLKISKPDKPELPAIDEDILITKIELLKGLKYLRLGEWHGWYDLRRYGMYSLDGTQWKLEIHFSNGYKPFISRGDSVFPYNFSDFKKLIGIGLKGEEDFWWLNKIKCRDSW